jgi:hypothetical protein
MLVVPLRIAASYSTRLVFLLTLFGTTLQEEGFAMEGNTACIAPFLRRLHQRLWAADENDRCGSGPDERVAGFVMLVRIAQQLIQDLRHVWPSTRNVHRAREHRKVVGSDCAHCSIVAKAGKEHQRRVFLEHRPR